MTRPMGGLSPAGALPMVAALVPAFVVVFRHASAPKKSALADACAELSAIANPLAPPPRQGTTNSEGSR